MTETSTHNPAAIAQFSVLVSYLVGNVDTDRRAVVNLANAIAKVSGRGYSVVLAWASLVAVEIEDDGVSESWDGALEALKITYY